MVDELLYPNSQYVAFRDNINLGDPLPPKFEFAMGCLEALLCEQLKECRCDSGQLLN